MKREIIIGTRESRLAMWQAHWVKEALEKLAPDYNYGLRPIKTLGDKHLDRPLAQIGDKGLFTKELEEALLKGAIHLAVHSVKDLPTLLPAGLTLAAVCAREKPNDVLVSRQGQRFADLPPGAVIGTGSLRRRAQLAYWRPDLQTTDLRGNLNTRLEKLESGLYDAIILAWAGMNRLGQSARISEIIPPDKCMPAVGQGALGIEVVAADALTLSLAGKLEHPATRCAVAAERAFLRRLEGGCRAPIGALGAVAAGRLTLEGVVAAWDGRKLLRASLSGAVDDPAATGALLAERLLGLGAGELLDECRQEYNEHGG